MPQFSQEAGFSRLGVLGRIVLICQHRRRNQWELPQHATPLDLPYSRGGWGALRAQLHSRTQMTSGPTRPAWSLILQLSPAGGGLVLCPLTDGQMPLSSYVWALRALLTQTCLPHSPPPCLHHPCPCLQHTCWRASQGHGAPHQGAPGARLGPVHICVHTCTRRNAHLCTCICTHVCGNAHTRGHPPTLSHH